MDRLEPARVDLVVNCYERTYRDVLDSGFMARLEADNDRSFSGRYVLINNVDDLADAQMRAEARLADGELTGYVFVADHVAAALARVRLPARALRRRGHFLDYGLVMSSVGQSPYVLGWDAEVRLEEPHDWVGAATQLLARRPDVFSAAPRWPARGRDTLEDESAGADGPWRLTWGFSDQVFLVRRTDLASPVYRRFAPAALARHAAHPFTFEARLESYQRASRRYRATLSTVRYSHNDLAPVLDRVGGPSRSEVWRRRGLNRLRHLLRHAPRSRPRFRP